MAALAALVRTPLRGLGTRWVLGQERRHRPHADRLSAEEREGLARHFTPATLEWVRVRVVDRIDQPWFLAWLRRLGLPLDFDLASSAGVTYGSVVLISTTSLKGSRPSLSLLFHELVHVVQYDLLGVAGFVDEYVRGWLDAGCVYRLIPLEQQAYELEEAFGTSAFSVEQEVARWFAPGSNQVLSEPSEPQDPRTPRPEDPKTLRP